MYPYGSFRVQGDYTASGDLTLRPQCERGVDNCDASSTVWLRKPFLLNHGLDAVVPFGLSLQVRSPGDDGVAFEHVRGAVASWDGVVDPGAHVKMRRVPECEAELSFVVDCMPAGEEDEVCASAHGCLMSGACVECDGTCVGCVTACVGVLGSAYARGMMRASRVLR